VTPEPFVDADAAAKFLCIRPRRLLQLAREGRLPGHPLGAGLRRVWRFRYSELAEAMLDLGRQSPAPSEEN
jgi:hypothetical protein